MTTQADQVNARTFVVLEFARTTAEPGVGVDELQSHAFMLGVLLGNGERSAATAVVLDYLEQAHDSACDLRGLAQWLAHGVTEDANELVLGIDRVFEQRIAARLEGES